MAYGGPHDRKLAELIARFYADPLGYVMFNWDWDHDPDISLVELPEKYQLRYGCKYGPDEWACEFLESLGEEVRKNGFDGQTAVEPILMATASGHGIGKSALVAWLIKWIMDTRPLSKGTVTANTDTQLRTKTWAQLGFWHNKSLTKSWFKYNSGRGNMSLRHVDPNMQDSWFCTAQTCREENSEAFAGQHAPQATSFYIFDEAGGVPDKIYTVREGGLTDGEPMAFDFGNPTRNSGGFYERCVGKLKHRYIVRSIDSRTVKITNKGQIEKWREDYGEDSDFFKVRVRGIFPSLGNTQFIPTHLVAQARTAPDLTTSTLKAYPLVLGVDCGRMGDDESVIYPRQGPDARTYPARRLRGVDTVELTAAITSCYNEFAAIGVRPAMIFVDQGNFGIAVVDNLRHLGYPVQGVDFGRTARDKLTYRYVVDELWGRIRDHLATGLLLPMHGETATDLDTQLTQREYGYVNERVALESKKEMKARLTGEGANDVGSPDVADALACTYYLDMHDVMHMMAKGETREQEWRHNSNGGRYAGVQFPGGGEGNSYAHDYDPLAKL